MVLILDARKAARSERFFFAFRRFVSCRISIYPGQIFELVDDSKLCNFMFRMRDIKMCGQSSSAVTRAGIEWIDESIGIQQKAYGLQFVV